MFVVGWAAGAVVILGCASPGTQPGDGAAVGLSSPPSPSASSRASATAKAGGVPGDGVPGDGVPGDGVPGDGAPHNAENNAWKQRTELTATQQQTGQALAARIQPKLEALRVAGDLTPESTRQALLGFGLAADDVQVTPMWPAADTGVVPRGAAFGIRFLGSGCVIGDVRAERVSAEVTGAGADFGCLEPQTH